MNEYLLVAIGGCIGAVLRYGTARLLQTVWRHPFPLATFTVNMIGSFLLGWLSYQRNEQLLLFVGTGIMGALTTYSTWMIEQEQLRRKRLLGWSIRYLIITLLGGFLFAYAGMIIGEAR